MRTIDFNGMKVNVLDASHLNEFEGYDNTVAYCQIQNCGFILTDPTYGDPIDDEYLLADLYEHLEANQMARV